MHSFFVARPGPQPSHPPPRDPLDQQCDREWAISTIKKASLKVQDVGLKLDLSKVIQFMEFYPKAERTRSHLITFGPSSAFDLDYSRNEGKTEQIIEDQSELGVNMSQSVLSRELSSSLPTSNNSNTNKKNISEERLFTEQTSIVEGKEEENHHKLKWRSVVTQNVLDEDDKQSQTFKQLQSNLDDLNQENCVLRKCLTDVLLKLKSKQLIEVRGNLSQLSTEQIQECCTRVNASQILQKLADFDAMMTQFESTVRVCEELNKGLDLKAEECRRYQKLLRTKEEERTPLQVVQKNLESRIACLSQINSLEVSPTKPKKVCSWKLEGKELGKTAEQ